MEPTDRADPSPQSDIKTLELLRQQAYDFYVRKSYSESADVYAQASEVQARLYGEDDGANADLLYLYGRSLYQVGVGKSDVLGGKVTETEVTRPKAVQPSRSRPSQPGDIHPGSQERVIADAIRDVRSESLGQALEKSDGAPSKPFFSISGDEDLISTNGQHDGNDMPSDDDLDGGDDDDEGAGGPDNEDELALAWEILDLSRLMFKKQLEGYLGSNISSDGDHKTPITASDPIQQTSPSTQQRPPLPVRQVEERLADVHDLLAEISLEGEDFALAVTDFRASLLYKNKLYPTESELIAEAHFKLSLALELAGNTSATEGGDLESEGDSAEAHAAASRKEAEAEMELAIESCKARIRREEEKLRNMGDTPDSAEHQAAAKKSEKRRADVKEMILEMEQRVSFLPTIAIAGSSTHELI